MTKILIGLFLFILFTPRPVQAIACVSGTTDFAPWAAYNIPADGNCGITEGHEDCFDAATNKCWPFIVKKTEAVCRSGYHEIFRPPWNDVWGVIFYTNCPYSAALYPKTCCLTDSNGHCTLWPGTGLNNFDPLYCQHYYQSVAPLTDTKDYCLPPAHYVTTAPLLQACQTAGAGTNRGVSATPLPAPGAWLGLIPTGGAIAPGLGLGFFTDKLVPFLISLLFYLILSLSLIFLIVGGIMWIISGGEKEALTKAKATVTWAIVALALALSSFIILNIVGTFFGSNLLGP